MQKLRKALGINKTKPVFTPISFKDMWNKACEEQSDWYMKSNMPVAAESCNYYKV